MDGEVDGGGEAEGGEEAGGVEGGGAEEGNNVIFSKFAVCMLLVPVF